MRARWPLTKTKGMMMDERLTDDEIVAIVAMSENVEPGVNGYVLPISFAREVEAAVLARAAVPVVQRADPPRVTVLLPDGDQRAVDVALVDWTATGELQVCITVGEQPQEPVAWMWQHDETGMTGFVQHAPDDELRQWERMNRPRKIVTPLYAAPLARQEPADGLSAVDATEQRRALLVGEWDWSEVAREPASGVTAAHPLHMPTDEQFRFMRVPQHENYACEKAAIRLFCRLNGITRRLNAQCTAASAECAATQRHITDMLVAHRDMIEAQQRADSAAEVLAVQRMEAARAAVAASGVAPVEAPSITDEELTRRFTRCAYPGPNPMYRCNGCGAEEFGVRNLLMEHALACGVAPTQATSKLYCHACAARVDKPCGDGCLIEDEGDADGVGGSDECKS